MSIPVEEAMIILDFLIDATPEDELPRADVIFVFGHVDIRVPKYAARLYNLGKAPLLVLTGGIGTRGRDPNSFKSEAEFCASVVIQNGVSAHSLILETESRHTLENVQFGVRALRRSGVNPESVILVVLPPLLRRSRATFRKQVSGAVTYGAGFPMGAEEWIYSERRVRRMLGEIDRLHKYAEKGDIARVRIPDEVQRAYDKVSEDLS